MTRGPAEASSRFSSVGKDPHLDCGAESHQLRLLLQALVEASRASPQESVRCIVALVAPQRGLGPCWREEGTSMQCFLAIGQVLKNNSSSLGRFAAALQCYVQAKEWCASGGPGDTFDEAFDDGDDARMFSLAAALFLDALRSASDADAAAVQQVMRIFVGRQTDEVMYRHLQGEAISLLGADIQLPDWARDSPFSGERIAAFGGPPSVEAVCSDMDYMMGELSRWEQQTLLSSASTKLQLPV